MNHSSGDSGPVVGPGALKPSVGDGKESSRLLVHSHWYTFSYIYVWHMVRMYVRATLYFTCMQMFAIKVQCLGMLLVIEVSLHM